MLTQGKRRITVWFSIGALAAMIPLALLAIPGAQPRNMLARHWAGRLAAAADEDLPLRLRQIAGLESAGLPALVDAVSSDREPLSLAAFDVLNQLLDRWQLEPSGESSPKVARLARLLAEQSKRGGPKNRRRRSDLATRLLLWPVDRQAIEASKLVADCETVLRAHLGDPAVDLSDPGLTDAPSSNSPAALVETPGGRLVEPSATQPLPEPPVVAFSARVTDGAVYSLSSTSPQSRPTAPALPAEIAQLPELPRPESEMPTATVPIADIDMGFARPPEVVTEPPITLSPVSPSILGHGESANTAQEAPGPLPAPDSNAGPIASLPDRIVMDDLLAQDPSVATAAARELQRRGFEPAHLELARRLVDTDPDVRLALVDTVMQVPRLDARPWLVWLTRDKDPIVRKATVAVIATSNDPSLRQQLVELERDETDAEVLRFVRSVLQPRRR